MWKYIERIQVMVIFSMFMEFQKTTIYSYIGEDSCGSMSMRAIGWIGMIGGQAVGPNRWENKAPCLDQLVGWSGRLVHRASWLGKLNGFAIRLFAGCLGEMVWQAA